MRLFMLFVGFVLCSLTNSAFAQTSEYITNPSFEDKPHANRPPIGWEDCGFEDESPVDVHGPETEFFGAKEFAADGETFLGMVIRDNETYEGVSARLLQPLLADSTYEITIKVNQAEKYHSVSRVTNRPANYISPTLLEIWGGVLNCQMNTFMWKHKIEDYGFWDEVTFFITPDKNIRYLSLFARHPENYENTNGHVLVDDLQIAKVNSITFEKN